MYTFQSFFNNLGCLVQTWDNRCSQFYLLLVATSVVFPIAPTHPPITSVCNFLMPLGSETRTLILQIWRSSVNLSILTGNIVACFPKPFEPNYLYLDSRHKSSSKYAARYSVVKPSPSNPYDNHLVETFKQETQKDSCAIRYLNVLVNKNLTHLYSRLFSINFLLIMGYFFHQIANVKIIDCVDIFTATPTGNPRIRWTFYPLLSISTFNVRWFWLQLHPPPGTFAAKVLQCTNPDGAVVVAQLEERSLPNTEICSSNPVYFYYS